MANAYSPDLRARVVDHVEAGHSRRAAAAHFAVSVSFVVILAGTVMNSVREAGTQFAVIFGERFIRAMAA